MSYFHMASATLSSALFRFTTEFGMGSGGSKTLLSPSKNCKFGKLLSFIKNCVYFSRRPEGQPTI